MISANGDRATEDYSLAIATIIHQKAICHQQWPLCCKRQEPAESRTRGTSWRNQARISQRNPLEKHDEAHPTDHKPSSLASIMSLFELKL